MLNVSHDGNPNIYNIYTDKIHKKSNNGLNQKVNKQGSQHSLQVS